MKYTRILIASLAILGFGFATAAACSSQKSCCKDKGAKETSAFTLNAGGCCPSGDKSGGKDEA